MTGLQLEGEMAQGSARRIVWSPLATASSAERSRGGIAAAAVPRPTAIKSRALPGRPGRRSSPAVIAARAKAHIDQHYQVHVSLATLADELGISREHLCRSFRGHFRVTVTDYIRARRIEQALALIDSPEVQLKEVGFAVGYTSYNEFFRAFKRVVKMTPTSFVHNLRVRLRSGT